eukprot:4261586-Ditylum_brightwellii.AAC.1
MSSFDLLDVGGWVVLVVEGRGDDRRLRFLSTTVVVFSATSDWYSVMKGCSRSEYSSNALE